MDKIAELFDWDEDGEYFYRPKGMHQKTYERLSAKYYGACEAANNALAPHLLSLMRRFD